MKKLLLLHATIEMIAGVIFVFRPDLILMFTDQGVETLFVAKIYAILMFSFGAICFFLYSIFEYNRVFKKTIMVIMAFHLMLALQMFSGFKDGIVANTGPFALHIVLAAVFAIGYMREMNLFVEPPDQNLD